MKERLVQLINSYPCMSTAEDNFLESISADLADYILANGVVVVDTHIVSPKNLPLITHIAGYPIDEVISLMEAKEAGRIAELPCAVGDDIYWVYYKRAEIKRYIVRSINIIVLDNHITTTIQFHEPNGYREFHYQFSPDCFGKTVFLTKEEAEKALKEKQQ